MTYLTILIFEILRTFAGVFPSAVDPNITYCIDAEEHKLYELIISYRESKGLLSVPLSSKLSKVAEAHVKDLVDNYDFDQGNPCNPHSWSKKGTWTPCCYTNDHKQASCMWDKPKEIAGYESAGYEIAYYSSAGASAKEGLEGWKKSKAHNPLLINSGMWAKVTWKAIGVGIHGNYAAVWFGEAGDEEQTVACN